MKGRKLLKGRSFVGWGNMAGLCIEEVWRSEDEIHTPTIVLLSGNKYTYITGDCYAECDAWEPDTWIDLYGQFEKCEV